MLRSALSLRARLLMWLLLPLVPVSALVLFDAYRSARETANEALDRVLAGSILAIAERVVVGNGGALEIDIPYVALDMLTSAAQDRVFYRVETSSGDFITGYRDLAAPETQEGGPLFFDGAFRGDPIRIAVLNGAAAGTARSVGFRVLLAETTGGRETLARALLVRSGVRLGILLAVATAVVWVGVTLGLRPLTRLQGAIGRRTPDDLRPIADQVPAEVRPLTLAINAFMERLGGALAALRAFTGNASHQLRTPLTVIRAQIELARRSDGGAEAAEALDLADRSAVEAERILSQLLLLARVEEASAQRLHERVDVAALVRQVTQEHLHQARKAGIDLGLEEEGAPVFVMANELLLGELLRNLLDNVVAHARGATHATVRVQASEDGPSAVIEVEDDGPGVPPEDRAEALKRFGRVPAETRPGAGLGLAIAQEITALFGGAISLSSPECGSGLRVRVMIPRQDGGRKLS